MSIKMKKKKIYYSTGNCRAIATTGGKQENITKALKVCRGQTDTWLLLTPLSWQKGENSPPLLRQGPSLLLVTRFELLQIH